MNSFGRLFRVEIFGESHGPAVGAIVDGCPPGIAIAPADFEADMARRRSGAVGTTERHEADVPEILSGVFEGRSTGSPICLVVRNADTRSADYEDFKRVLKLAAKLELLDSALAIKAWALVRLGRRGEADVLLSTTIIESGLDIPNANTIIIDRADRFGLSDLYQLRGRVGRYKHQAYAYLLLPRHAGLLSDARKRISAIKQYSTLGSGFKIAMRDLEIRGAGNLLGAQQSGHIAAIGFELYCQLLKQSVGALKGEKARPRADAAVRLDFLAMSPEEPAPPSPPAVEPAPQRPRLADISIPRDVAVYQAAAPEPEEPASPPERASAHIPANYIPDARQRIEIHRKLAEVNELTALDALKRELRDRFGPLPAAAELALRVRELRILAAGRGVSAIESKEGKLMLTRNNDYIMVGGKFPRLTKTAPEARLNEIKRLLLAL